MMKKLLVITLILLCSHASFGQLSVVYSAGIGTYNLGDLKNFQDELLRAVPQLPLKKVNAFPPYLYFDGMVETGLGNKIILGIGAGFYSTGARNNLSDYSGAYSFTIPVKSWKAGLNMKFGNHDMSSNKFAVLPGLGTGIRLANVNLNEEVMIYGMDPFIDSQELLARSFYIEASLTFRFRIRDKLHGFFLTGWEQDKESKLFAAGQDDRWLVSNNGNTVHCSMSGIRCSLGLVFDIIKAPVQPYEGGKELIEVNNDSHIFNRAR